MHLTSHQAKGGGWPWKIAINLSYFLLLQIWKYLTHLPIPGQFSPNMTWSESRDFL